MDELKTIALLQAAWRYLRIILRQAQAMLRLSEDVEAIAERQKFMAEDMDRKIQSLSDELEQTRKLNQIKMSAIEARMDSLERTRVQSEKPRNPQSSESTLPRKPNKALATIIDSNGRPLRRRSLENEAANNGVKAPRLRM